MSAHIEVDGSLQVPKEILIGYVANHSIPGETVRLAPKLRFRDEPEGSSVARLEQFGDRELTVTELRLDATPEGPRLHYRFDGIEGLHNAKAFTNPEGYEQDFGVLIHRDGETWFVPLKDIDGAVNGEAKHIATTMSRCGHYHFGLPDEILEANGREGISGGATAEDFLAEHEADPTAGEYAMSPLPDGTWRLDASPWMAPASDKEVAVAEEAIAAARSVLAPR